ncbi:HAMP domain-containing histidine kinase [Clostridioides sp. ES-S-0123-01]|uniref:sensor histidine kinase n=1 Tax=Clostridioides sp. ES-S-0123-01 TaxID=2770783 RepID=UPI001D12E5C2|nr:HAMP domain-containing histidine kinase [Clostridioides sp. ES-S-0123-01]
MYWIKKSLNRKVFLSTTLILILSCTLIYIFIMMSMPKTYKSYLTDDIKKNLNEFVKVIEKTKYEDSTPKFYDFIIENNVSINLMKNGKSVEIPSNIKYGKLGDENIISNKKQRTIFNEDNFLYNYLNNNQISGSSYVSAISTDITFKNSSDKYILSVMPKLMVVDEASMVLLKLIPVVTIMILIISLVTSFIYSRVITKPVVKISNTSKKIAQMNLDVRCDVESDDEIGSLALSLNELAHNLSSTLNNLEHANLKLQEDIEKERKNEISRRTFFAAVSHELKTPITIIKGQLEGMIYNVGMYKDRDAYLIHSLKVMESMEEMVREILDISRMESSGFKLNTVEINMSSLVQKSIQNYLILAENKNIDVITDIEKNLYSFVDIKLMKKAISNIINNSIKHSKNGVLVSIKLYKNNECGVFEVENSNTFIEESEIENIFNPFYRVDKSRSRQSGGSGLGLYIIKVIFDMHKVKYKIENTSVGVKFTAIFPIALKNTLQ